MEKETSRRFVHKAPLPIGNLLIHRFFFGLYHKDDTFLNHRDLLACVLVYNARETTWFLEPESTSLSHDPSHHDFRTCVDLW